MFFPLHLFLDSWFAWVYLTWDKMVSECSHTGQNIHGSYLLVNSSGCHQELNKLSAARQNAIQTRPHFPLRWTDTYLTSKVPSKLSLPPTIHSLEEKFAESSQLYPWSQRRGKLMLFLGKPQLKGKPPYGMGECLIIIILTATQEHLGYTLGSWL